MTFYDQVLVLEAFVLTVATTMALTMYTLQSKRDYSSWGAGYVLITVLGSHNYGKTGLAKVVGCHIEGLETLF